MDELELEESLPVTTIYAEDGDPIEAHRTDDPNVWGLVDVARGRTPSAPTTIYNIAGDSASGVAGVLFPDNNFLPAVDSQVGTSVIVGDWYGMKPVYHEPVVELEIAWDGAAKSPLFENEDGELVREHSKGILLGDYSHVRNPLTATGAAKRGGTRMENENRDGRRRSLSYNVPRQFLADARRAA